MKNKEKKIKGLIERSYVEGDEYYYRDNEMMRVEIESDVKSNIDKSNKRKMS